jgi:abortive infection bacteriophage resistance protein
LKLKTTPKIKDAWKTDLYKFEGKSEMYTDRIAVVILIIYFFIKQINSSYQFADIRFSLNKIIDEKKENAEQIGFKEINSIDTIYKPKPKKRYKHHKQYKKTQAK